MRAFILLTFVVLVTVSHIAETRPKEYPKRTSKEHSDSETQKTKYVGCVFPYQYVNPYYHTYTARTCANLLLDRVHINIPLPESDDYTYGCDCIPGFALNYQGYCIDEAQCNLWEAFGTLINEQAIGSNGAVTMEQTNHDQMTQNEHDPQKLEESHQFYRENAEIPEKPGTIDWDEPKIQEFNSNNINNLQLSGKDESFKSHIEDEDDCCNEGDDCEDETSENNNTERQTASLIPTESVSTFKATTPMAPLMASSNSSDPVTNVEPKLLEISQPSVVGTS